MSAEAVARYALIANATGSAIAVPGMLNKAAANLPRLVPRFMVRKMAGYIFKHD